MRRASVLVAVTAVSLVIVSACTSFPDLTVDEAGGDDDAASSSGGGDGATATGDAGGAGHDGGPSTADAAAGKDAGSDASSGTKDSGTGIEAGPPDPCAANILDCTAPATKSCPACMSTCKSNSCAGGTPNCCAVAPANSGKYQPCCYTMPIPILDPNPTYSSCNACDSN
jgi:hypothetical protein